MRLRTRTSHQPSFTKRAATIAITVAVVPALAGLTGQIGAANAWGPGSAKKPPRGFSSTFINGAGMPNVKVRVWKSTTTNPATSPTVVLLDGLRATWDVSGWERDTNVAFLSQKGINVVTPVGGTASFYTNWNSPSNFNGQKYRYTWGTWLATSLPNYLRQLGIANNVSLVGLSMAGSASLINGINNRGFYKRAAALSGALNLSSPGMPTAVRIAMLDAGGWNSDSMWGPPWSGQWRANDPTVQIAKFRGYPLWISSGNGVPGRYTPKPSGADIVQGVPLELLVDAQTKAFQAAAKRAGVTKVRYDFPPNGTHTWGYWQDQVWKMLGAGFFNQY